MSKSIYLLACVFLIACTSTTTNNTSEQTTMSNTNKDWIYNTNIYEVNLRQYTKEGTIKAFANEIPRLKDMGVKTLWFMPITPIAQKNKKGSLGSYYAAADYTSVSPEFGTVKDFKELVDQAHSQGLKVIIDWVANHTGWDHVWTKAHPEYYLKDSTTNDFLIASGMDDIIELDFSNPNLRRAMIDAMKFWITETGIDGFRCDLAFWVELDFWKEAKAELDKVKPLFWFAESDPLERPEYMEVFDVAYTWTWMHKAKDFYQKSFPIDSLDAVLDRYKQAPGVESWFTTNHDENSWNGTEYEKYGDMALPLAVFSTTWPGVPLIYSGQELPNKKRLEFFEKDPIPWTGENQLHGFYKSLLSLRETNPALYAIHTETIRLTTSANDKVFSYLRKKGNSEVLVLLNLSKDKIRFSLDDKAVTGRFKNIFSFAENDFTSEKSFEMQPWEYLVYEK